MIYDDPAIRMIGGSPIARHLLGTSAHSRKVEPMYLSHEELRQVVALSPRPVLLSGPPQTGKTDLAIPNAYKAEYAGQYASTASQQPLYNITLTSETPDAELRGHWIPKGHGEFTWHDGPVCRAWREGGLLILNELDRSSSCVHTLLYAILDDPAFAQLTLPTGETIRPAPGFRCVATMNGAPEELPEALLSRFPVRIQVDELCPEAWNRLPAQYREAAKNSEIGIRDWLGFVALANFVDRDVAMRAVFGPRAKDLLDAIKLSQQ